jgi:hypothetical protein
MGDFFWLTLFVVILGLGKEFVGSESDYGQ